MTPKSNIINEIKYRIDLGSLIGENPTCNLKCKYCHKDYFSVTKDTSQMPVLHFVESLSMLEEIFKGDKRAKKIHFTGRVEPLIVSKEKLIEEVEKINEKLPDKKMFNYKWLSA
ncbi:MAG: hypothetical protein ACP5P3_01330 [Ignavibacteria bacterium]